MACSCQGSSGSYQVVQGDGTVPGQVNGQPNSFATAQDAQAALTAAGTGGWVRRRPGA